MKVFDSSAVLAIIFREPGAEEAARLVEEGDGVISSVNHSEIISKLLDRKLKPADIAEICDGFPIEIVPFTLEHARIAGQLRDTTRSVGLSLGDRCCLALARSLQGATVITTDKVWKTLKAFDVRLIR